ncbi:Stk1 family PASTA domain-containing Ser/Thr kinase [Fusibacter sp. JL298sf-3]
MTQLIGKILSNRYEVLSVVGTGGMATVYEGKDLLLNRMVAIKVLKPEFASDEEFIKKFQQESQAAAKLIHPNIVNVFDVGYSDDVHYIIMELVKGGTLKDYLMQLKTHMREEAVISIALQIASALAEAHSKDVVHRDIKAQNILINEQGDVKVADFGIARATTTTTLVNTKEIIGSVHYASPEQARGGFVDARSDIYSLGILMFELVTKVLPFEAESPVAVALQQIKDDLPDIRDYNSEVGDGLCRIIEKATQKTPADRYPSATALIEDLKRIKEDRGFAPVVQNGNHENTMVMPKLSKEEIMAHKPKEKPGRKKLNKTHVLNSALVIVSAFVLAVMLFGIFAFGKLKTFFEVPTVEVPLVVNASVEDAQRMLTELGLVVDATNRVYDAQVKADHVVEQSVKEGEEVKEGYTVVLTISNGPIQKEIPDLKNQTLNDAQLMIQNNGFSNGEVTEDFSELPAGMIISQSPRSGTMHDEGRRIDLVVSKGPKEIKYIVPKVTGMTIREAEVTLNQLGFKLGKIDKEFSDKEKGQIITQSNLGVEMPQGSFIDVVVSDGPEAKPEPPVEETPDEPGEGGETGGEEDGGTVQKTLAFVIETAKFEADAALVKIELVQGDTTTVVYSKEHFKTEGAEINVGFTVKGTGDAMIMVYYDDKKVDEVSITF